MDKETNDNQIKVKKEVFPQIYAYIHPEKPEDEDWVKIGYTERKDATIRIKEQNETAAGKFKYETLWIHPSKYKNKNEMFKDHELHTFLQKVQGRQRRPKTEWFNYENLELKRESERDFNKFANEDFSLNKNEYTEEYYLRKEQEEAVNKTINYFKTHKNSEFLWNAKPRFGKTLSTLDLICKMEIDKALIVTNRPAISDSWFSDYEQFIKDNNDYVFVSSNSNIRNNAYNYEDYCKQSSKKMIAFVSLQDLKGSKAFGGTYEKNDWIKDTKWDLLVIDECHEGVDTQKTDIALNELTRNNTLQLSGTPFKAIEGGKFEDDAIYNWTYADEQHAKEAWNNNDETNNPYADLPRITMLTYQMGNIIYENDTTEDIVDDDKQEPIAFDLNEFFATKGSSKNPEFKHKNEVATWLESIFSYKHPKYPFATKPKKQELNHTFWILDRVDSVKALENLMNELSVLEGYKIINVAGNARDEEEATNNHLKRVRNAIKNNNRTITLSAGRLTTGVTVKEWSGVVVLSNMKSAAQYMQSAFRAQNPCMYKEDGMFKRKENCYVFDFSPARTLEIYDEFANGLNTNTASGSGTEEERKTHIKELLNFFPIIAEDENGDMVEINETQVLSLPKTIKAREVVEHGFMSNLLFTNIGGIFVDKHAVEIINNLEYCKQQKIVNNEDVDFESVELDENGNVLIQPSTIVSSSDLVQKAPEYIRSICLMKDISEGKIEGATAIATAKNAINSLKHNEELVKIATAQGISKTKKDKLLKSHIDNSIKKIDELLKRQEIELYDLNHKKELEIVAEPNKNKQLEIKLKYNNEAQTLKEKHSAEIVDLTYNCSTQTIQDTVKDMLATKPNEAKKEQEENIRGRLRGFARTIPAFLMAYGDEKTCLSNFDKIVSNEVFQEVTNITLDQFRELRDKFQVFDKKVFDQSCRTFMNYRKRFANYFDETVTKDIFSYIPPQSNNQIFTPRKVVNLMLDSLEEEYPDIFKNPNLKFCDLYVKSGLYLTGIIKRLYAGLRDEIPDDKARIKHIVENQIYGFAPSDIIYNIAKNYIFGFDEECKSLDSSHLVNLDTIPYAKDEADKPFEEKLKEVFGEDMKFDVIVGNPPYQEEIEGRGEQPPIYNYFLDMSYRLSDLVCQIHPARFLFNAGKTPEPWNKKMLNDPHFKVVHYQQEGKKLFANTDIKGGVSITIRDSNQNFGPIGTFIHLEKLKGIRNKVNANTNNNFSNLIYSNTSYKYSNLFFKENPQFAKRVSGGSKRYISSSAFDKFPEVFTSNKPDDKYTYSKILGLQNLKREFKYFPERYLNPPENYNFYKVLVPASNGSGAIGEVLATPLIGSPLIGHSETFISIGCFKCRSEAESCLRYIKSKFARTLLGIKKVTQGNKRKEVWSQIPLQDFTENSDIDWSKSIPEIDQQLYKKYNLDESEIAFIEEKVKAME